MKFSLAMRAASHKDHTYRGVQFGSRHGKEIVAQSILVEKELYKMIVGDRRGEYKQRVLAAKRKLFGDRWQEPILSDEDMEKFGNRGSLEPNSHFSIVHYGVALAESGRNPFEDMKATTPMHTSLVCLMNRLFTDDWELDIAIDASFDFPKRKEDDLDFHDEIGGWSAAILLDDRLGYDSRHRQMTKRLKHPDVLEMVGASAKKSVEVTRVCREAMARAMASGRFG
jgi:hypothetical protein